MVRLAQERVLLIGDSYRQVHTALSQALPSAQITSVASHFDGVAELVANNYTAVVAAAEPIERRPEAAVRQLRELAGEGRVVLFGHPTLELLSRKMLEFGVDDYLIMPASSGEIEQIFRGPPVRRVRPAGAEAAEPPAGSEQPEPAPSAWPGSAALAEVALDALLQSPHDPVTAAVKRLAAQAPDGVTMAYQSARGATPEPRPGMTLLSHPVYAGQQEVGILHLFVPDDAPDAAACRAALPPLSELLGKLALLQDRHNALQRAAITDELTGLYNARHVHPLLIRIL